MKNIIACRILSYGKYQDRGWSHLPEIGIRNVEVAVPAPAEESELRRKLADHGLTVTSLIAKCDIAQALAVEAMRPQLEACERFGAGICFLSIKAGETDRAVVWQRLREIGEAAARHRVTVAIETHPDLAMNGDIARATIESVDHPSIRINFDTANIYFYNQNTSAVAELKRVIDYVAAVHLKDTPGGYQEWTFPALGTGVVDFPEVFRLLHARGFYGPFTMELEGTKGIERTEQEQLDYVRQSAEYLRRIGAAAV
jgi:sugar phosphate isomerase/epimerase